MQKAVRMGDGLTGGASANATPYRGRWRRRVLLGLAAFVLLAAGTALYGLSGAAVPPQGMPVDLDAWRTLAGPNGPRVARTVEVSSGAQPGLFLRAGGDFSMHDLPVYPVELVWDAPEGEVGRSVLIEPATDAACAKGNLPVARFDAGAYARMQAAMRRAESIVTTHEHFDHVCGLTSSPDLEELAPKAKLTPAQLESTARMTGMTDRARALFTPFVADGPTRVAPGVLMVPVAGHTPGSVWFFVRMRDGREWLFVGDTLWTAEALRTARMKPRLMGWADEDEPTQAALLRTLLDLRAAYPALEILVAHDAPTWRRMLKSGAMQPL